MSTEMPLKDSETGLRVCRGAMGVYWFTLVSGRTLHQQSKLRPDSHSQLQQPGPDTEACRVEARPMYRSPGPVRVRGTRPTPGFQRLSFRVGGG
ncbi:hypothetical protein AAFF_G00340260 [Aldrovandia affinis]|uniref:Uncharacterized protein n=1 Tax=Aldrovandia affinis TaxID=143900 RepID=A0AAD7SL40_9TELE|nr:hypothetical protein AAFF_G00340260 [Aldrovandia affinis]